MRCTYGGSAVDTTGSAAHVHPQRNRTTTSISLQRNGGSPEGFVAAWEQGRALSAREAVAYAAKGRGPCQRPATGWASLTTAEREVARLAAQGLTNPEIGRRLFISRRTAQTHLAHIYAKLSISSRAQLPRNMDCRCG